MNLKNYTKNFQIIINIEATAHLPLPWPNINPNSLTWYLLTVVGLLEG